MADHNESHISVPDSATPGSGPPVQEQPVLPPVEPPTGAFLVQLFFVPMVIVSVIVSIWMAFSWLAQRGETPQELVGDLERLNKGAWQRAYRLVEELRQPQNEELRKDEVLAQQLAGILERQLEEGSLEEQQVWMRMFVARALGHFDIDTGVSALIRAAETQVDPKETGVRRAALQSLGVLAGKKSVGAENIRSSEGVYEALKSASEQFGAGASVEEIRENGLVRSTAAYVLGLVGGEQATEKLVELLDDPYPDARYNAATGLARHGDKRAEDRLLEMLELNNDAAVKYEVEAGEHKWKQALVMVNGLKATQQLIEANDSIDRTNLREAANKLINANVVKEVKVRARETVQAIDR